MGCHTKILLQSKVSHKTLFRHGFKMCCGNYEKIDKRICNWFVVKKAEKIPIDGITIKEKSLGIRKKTGYYRIQSIRLLVE